jgi:hypothetical protein
MHKTIPNSERRQPTPSNERIGPRQCIVRLDRLQGYCEELPANAWKADPRFQSFRDYRLNAPTRERFQPYGRVHWYKSTSSGMRFCVEWKRLEAWLAPFRITMFADDATGLLPDEVFGVLEALPDFKLTMQEVAFDFAGSVTEDTALRYGLFGKSAPRRNPKKKGVSY